MSNFFLGKVLDNKFVIFCITELRINHGEFNNSILSTLFPQNKVS